MKDKYGSVLPQNLTFWDEDELPRSREDTGYDPQEYTFTMNMVNAIVRVLEQYNRVLYDTH